MEIIVFLLVIVIGIFWQLTSNDRISHLLLQGIYALSYIPTISGLVKGTGKEHYVAWIVAFIAYLFSTISIAYDPQADWVAFVHPIVNGLLGNGIIVCLIFYKKLLKRREKSVYFRG